MNKPVRTIAEFLEKWAFKAEMGSHRGEYEAWGHARAVRESMERDLKDLLAHAGKENESRSN